MNLLNTDLKLIPLMMTKRALRTTMGHIEGITVRIMERNTAIFGSITTTLSGIRRNPLPLKHISIWLLTSLLIAPQSHAQTIVIPQQLLNHTDTYGNVSLRNSAELILPDPLVIKGNLILKIARSASFPIP